MTAFLYLIPGIIIFLSVYFALRSFRMTGSATKAVRVNLVMVACLFVACIATSFAASAASETDVSSAPAAVESVEGEHEESAAAPSYDPSKGLGMLAAAMVTGISGIGGGIAVAAGAPAAIGATSEDPKAFGKALIFVALGESIALYGLVISIMILGKY